MDMSPQEYQAYIKERAPKSPIWKDTALAFLIGGAICVLGQLILDGYQSLGLDKTDAGTATSITLVFLAALATGLILYNSLARFAGAGTLVPIRALPTPSSHPPSTSRPRASSPAWRRRCSSSRGR